MPVFNSISSQTAHSLWLERKLDGGSGGDNGLSVSGRLVGGCASKLNYTRSWCEVKAQRSLLCDEVEWGSIVIKHPWTVDLGTLHHRETFSHGQILINLTFTEHLSYISQSAKYFNLLRSKY